MEKHKEATQQNEAVVVTADKYVAKYLEERQQQIFERQQRLEELRSACTNPEYTPQFTARVTGFYFTDDAYGEFPDVYDAEAATHWDLYAAVLGALENFKKANPRNKWVKTRVDVELQLPERFGTVKIPESDFQPFPLDYLESGSD